MVDLVPILAILGARWENAHIFTPRGNFSKDRPPVYMFLGGGRNPKNLEEIRMNTRRPYETPLRQDQTEDPKLLGGSATHHTTMPVL